MYTRMSKASNAPYPADLSDDEYDDELFDCGANVSESDLDDSLESAVLKTRGNLKITIVPDRTQNAGLNGKPFDATLSPEVQVWFEQFKQIWNQYKKGPVVSKSLQIFYTTCDNPFLTSLKLFADCLNLSNIKPNSMAYAILEELQKYKKSNNSNVAKHVDDNLKMVAFNFVKGQGQLNLFKVAKDAFNLVESKALFVGEVKAMVQQQEYKEACQIATELELFQEFDLYELVLPLLLQDKETVVEEYLNGAVHLRRPLVELLDTFLDRKQSVANNCGWLIAKYNYPDVRYNKLDTKPMTKLIQRLAKMYDLPKELTPNMNKRHNHGALQFVIHKRFVEKSLNKDSWQEMVKVTVPMDANDLHVELVNACSDYGDISDGAMWAKHFDVPHSLLPLCVRELVTGQPLTYSKFSCPDDWDEETKERQEDFHGLNSDTKVHLVTTRPEFCEMMNHLREQSVVGFDTEWKPTFHGNNDVALIQLATRNRIYLIDVICLRVQSEDWIRLGRWIFNNDEILKLGFSPATDILVLQKSLPTLNLLPMASLAAGYLDLQELRRHVTHLPKFRFPFSAATDKHSSGVPPGENLSNLVYLCLGRKLDKSNQFSNWEKRPLRQDQIHYAALDAFCLLEVFDVIGGILTRLGYDFGEFINNILTESRGKRTNVSRKSQQ
ncbi:exonuclease mut-7 homolog [Phlebotomus argentipes]|uniref:exonuclease mut-7 homolog n=1 Tax=Phlebotomus argentipes TaxID=94469 RepID=UPI0028934740|nr:exonuclease mut-7 homolog [Phlebotomus argentipes]